MPQMTATEQENRQAPGDPQAGQETAGKWTVMGIVGLGVFMATLDASIVNISLPKISQSFHAPLNGLVEWVIIAYLIVIGSLLLILGRISDLVGQKFLWVAGLTVFTLSSILCGMAPSLMALVLFRVLQGVGGAMLMAISPAMITRAFPGNERGRAMGILGLIVAAGTSAGPTVGGVITQAFSWRWIFYLNVPLGIVGVLTTMRLLTARLVIRWEEQRFDPLGALLLAVSLGCLMLGLSFGQDLGWHSPVIYGLFAGAVAVFLIFVMWEFQVAEPIVDFKLFRNRLFAAALFSSFLCFLSLFAVMFLMPFYLEDLLALSAEEAGFLMTAVPLSIMVAAPVSGWLSDRFGSQILSSLGLAISCAGLWFLSRLTAGASSTDIIWRLVVTGLGQGIFQPPNNNAIMGAVPKHRVGIAAGFLATVRVLGQASSVALSGAVFAMFGGAEAGMALLKHAGAHAGHFEATFVQAFGMAMLACMGVASLGVLTSLMRGQSH